MSELLFAVILGTGAGIIDIIPMIIKKLDKYSIVSAFIQWVVLGIIITNTNLFGLTGWLNGLIIALLVTLPIISLVIRDDKKSVPIILLMSAILGSMIGLIETWMGM